MLEKHNMNAMKTKKTTQMKTTENMKATHNETMSKHT